MPHLFLYFIRVSPIRYAKNNRCNLDIITCEPLKYTMDYLTFKGIMLTCSSPDFWDAHFLLDLLDITSLIRNQVGCRHRRSIRVSDLEGSFKIIGRIAIKVTTETTDLRPVVLTHLKIEDSINYYFAIGLDKQKNSV